MKTPTYRKLYKKEIAQLEAQYCEATDWELVEVTPRFKAGRIRSCRFSGHVRLGAFEEAFTLPGGIVKPSGINNATLHNVTVGDNCCIENVQNYIANYTIGHHTFIENVDIIMVDGKSRFGNGVAVSVLNETGGREVLIHNKLSAQLAYIAALYRHSPSLIDRINSLTEQYAEKHASAIGSIGSYVTILNTSSIKNVRIGDHAYIEGASRLAGGSINSNKYAPIRIGHNVICEDFIISSGSSVTDGTMLTRCFVGQSCQLGHTYSASDSLFFSNCQGENGEACAIFAGPFTVTHHKSTLLIAGVFSFMNAGSGSNQSNHMYKLGPIHQGTLERGAKTASDSYILWPSRVGAFSLVMGRHVNHSDTSNLPFSYLIEQKNTTYLVPGVNLRSVGTMRDAAKWPKRDGRKDPQPLDCINFNLLSPYTIQKILKGRERLLELQHTSGELSDTYSFQSAKIKNSSLRHGIELYEMAIHNFFGNILIRRLQERPFRSDNDIRTLLQPITAVGRGEWVDISGMIAPKSEVDKIVEDIKLNRLETLGEINSRFQEIHQRYSLYEWTWAHDKMEDFYAIDLRKITAHQVAELIDQWQKAVVGLDQKVYKDAQKEFSLASKTGFGADGSRQDKENDFEQVRGDFENNPFVCSLLNHMKEKVAQGEALKHQLEQLA